MIERSKIGEEHYRTGRMEHAHRGSAGGRTCSEPQSKRQVEPGKEVGIKPNADENFVTTPKFWGNRPDNN